LKTPCPLSWMSIASLRWGRPVISVNRPTAAVTKGYCLPDKVRGGESSSASARCFRKRPPRLAPIIPPRCSVSLGNASAMRVDCQLRKPVGQALAANNFSLSRSSSLHIHDVVCSLQTSCSELLRYGLGEHSHSVVSMYGQNNLLLAQVDPIVASFLAKVVFPDPGGP
jgi:hypothetical protein